MLRAVLYLLEGHTPAAAPRPLTLQTKGALRPSGKL